MTNCTTNDNGSKEITTSFLNPTIKNNVFGTSTPNNSIVSLGSGQNNTNNIVATFNNIVGFTNPSNPHGTDGILGTADDGLTLACNSQARDFADNSVAPTLDIVGNAIYNTQKDAGAYERQTDAGCDIYTGTINCNDVTLQNISGNRWYNFFINSKLVASLNPNGQDLGNVNVKIGDNAGAIFSPSTGAYTNLGRGINVTSTIAPTTNYSLRLYYKDSEMDEYNTALNQNNNINFLSMAWKSAYANPSCDWINYSGSSFGTIPNGQIANQDYGLNDDGFYLQFDLDHFTIFAPTVAGSVLPLRLLDFSGKNISKTENLLEWKTAEEKNVSHFEIERTSQQNGELRWEKIGKVNALNNVQGGLYSFRDQLLIGNGFYYRLKIIDNDGRFEYSKIVLIENKKDKNVAIYPNPTRDILNISTDNYEQSFILLNSIGQTVLQGDFLEKSINLQSLPSGFYYLKIGAESYKVVRER